MTLPPMNKINIAPIRHDSIAAVYRPRKLAFKPIQLPLGEVSRCAQKPPFECRMVFARPLEGLLDLLFPTAPAQASIGVEELCLPAPHRSIGARKVELDAAPPATVVDRGELAGVTIGALRDHVAERFKARPLTGI